MRTTWNLMALVVLVVVLFAGAFSFLQVRFEKQRLAVDLERKAAALSRELMGPVREALSSGGRDEARDWAKRLDLRGLGTEILVYDLRGLVFYKTTAPLFRIREWASQVRESMEQNRESGVFKKWGNSLVYLYVAPVVHPNGPGAGALVLLQNAGQLSALEKEIWTRNLLCLLALLVPTLFLTLWVVRWRITRPIAQIADRLKRLRLGEDNPLSSDPRSDVLGALLSEVNHIAKSLTVARTAAEEEARLRLSAESVWTPEKLKEHVRSHLGNKPLFLVSNREPYMHVRQKRKIECVVPPSGLVTALEPVMRACGGLWIAHGSGDADRETCNGDYKVRVPPNEPAYTLKRVWLSKEEEDGYYYGFSNEGLWPLCHMTHVRPVFRLEDWTYYQRVNEKFAESLLKEIGSEEAPLILIQDYHFALLPALIRQKRPDARIAIFWHIPWPNPESFGICPWKTEILMGMLGADIIGFHTQFHGNNFLDTVDRTFESKIDWENFSAERGGQLTRVRPFPISVHSLPAFSAKSDGDSPSALRSAREMIARDYGVNAKYLAVGVDRLDYTKGIIERFKAIERFLEKHPEYLGKFTFAELGAPSRTHIQKYQDFVAEVEKTAEQINWRFQSKDWKPILLLKGQHSHADIAPFYQAADLCLVSSLHDGMNLVAKEFVSAREDEDGVLILSQFTGASRELTDALIVNPYDIESMADCIRLALEMPGDERRDRMRRMRAVVRDRNIYRWAANIISAMTEPAPFKMTVIA